MAQLENVLTYTTEPVNRDEITLPLRPGLSFETALGNCVGHVSYGRCSRASKHPNAVLGAV
jgi:hypothetical protein